MERACVLCYLCDVGKSRITAFVNYGLMLQVVQHGSIFSCGSSHEALISSSEKPRSLFKSGVQGILKRKEEEFTSLLANG